MPDLNLFPPDRIVGVFRGFSQGGLEFHANLVLPYRNDFQNIPMHGQFLLVQLETPFEGVLGRITSLHSAGKLSSGTGEEYNLRALREGRAVPELQDNWWSSPIGAAPRPDVHTGGGRDVYTGSQAAVPPE